MRLTAILWKKLPNGHIFRGKHRLVKKVDALALARLRWDYDREEQNMLLLRHPYLTVQQSVGSMKAIRNPDAIRINWDDEKIKKFTKVTTLEDRLMHLRVKDAWD